MKDIDGYVTKDELYRLISNIKMNPDRVVDDKTCSTIVEAISDMPTADVQPAKPWISVKDRQPKCIHGSSDSVLVYRDNGECEVAYLVYDHDDGFYWYTPDERSAFEFEEVTHWMPLPDPPKDGNTREHNEVNKPDGNCLDCEFQYLEDSDYWCSVCPGNPEDI